MKITRWAIDQVREHRPAGNGAQATMVQANVQRLVDTLAALRGSGDGQVFGMAVDRVEPEGRDALVRAVCDVLVEWKAHFDGAGDQVSALALDGVGAAYGIAALRLVGRPALRCDPLGSRAGLSAEWLRRLADLDGALSGDRAMNTDAIAFVGEDVDPSEIEAGPPDAEALHAFALRHEQATGGTFSRELAAWFSTANGIAIQDDPVLRPVCDWEQGDDGLMIGCGGYMQGSLTIEPDSRDQNLADARLVDRGDDGEVRAEYPSFAAFCDALLDRAPR